MRILWLSRHMPLEAQVRELRKRFGEDTVITQDEKPFSSAEEIVERMKKGGFEEIVTVAPLSVIAKLTELGVRPLWAEMQDVRFLEDKNFNPESDVKLPGPPERHFRFIGFRRIKRVGMEFEEV